MGDIMILVLPKSSQLICWELVQLKVGSVMPLKCLLQVTLGATKSNLHAHKPWPIAPLQDTGWETTCQQGSTSRNSHSSPGTVSTIVTSQVPGNRSTHMSGSRPGRGASSSVQEPTNILCHGSIGIAFGLTKGNSWFQGTLHSESYGSQQEFIHYSQSSSLDAIC